MILPVLGQGPARGVQLAIREAAKANVGRAPTAPNSGQRLVDGTVAPEISERPSRTCVTSVVLQAQDDALADLARARNIFLLLGRAKVVLQPSMMAL